VPINLKVSILSCDNMLYSNEGSLNRHLLNHLHMRARVDIESVLLLQPEALSTKASRARNRKVERDTPQSGLSIYSLSVRPLFSLEPDHMSADS
jgi:hypothetical protein